MSDRAPPPKPPADVGVAVEPAQEQNWRRWLRMRAWMRSELVHEWIRSTGILVAAAWGIYTFVYKDILVPAWQPASLTLEATITPVPGRRPGPDGREATLEARATNSSTRPVHVLSNYWILSGIRRSPAPPQAADEAGQLLSRANAVLRQPELSHFEPHVRSEPELTFLAIGRLFDDDIVQPGETINRSILVRIPTGTDAVQLRAFVPLLSRQPDQTLFRGRDLKWELIDPLNTRPILCDPVREPGLAPACAPIAADAFEDSLHGFDAHKSAINFRREFGLPDADGAGR